MHIWNTLSGRYSWERNVDWWVMIKGLIKIKQIFHTCIFLKKKSRNVDKFNKFKFVHESFFDNLPIFSQMRAKKRTTGQPPSPRESTGLTWTKPLGPQLTWGLLLTFSCLCPLHNSFDWGQNVHHHHRHRHRHPPPPLPPHHICCRRHHHRYHRHQYNQHHQYWNYVIFSF